MEVVLEWMLQTPGGHNPLPLTEICFRTSLSAERARKHVSDVIVNIPEKIRSDMLVDLKRLVREFTDNGMDARHACRETLAAIEQDTRIMSSKLYTVESHAITLLSGLLLDYPIRACHVAQKWHWTGSTCGAVLVKLHDTMHMYPDHVLHTAISSMMNELTHAHVLEVAVILLGVHSTIVAHISEVMRQSGTVAKLPLSLRFLLWLTGSNIVGFPLWATGFSVVLDAMDAYIMHPTLLTYAASIGRVTWPELVAAACTTNVVWPHNLLLDVLHALPNIQPSLNDFVHLAHVHTPAHVLHAVFRRLDAAYQHMLQSSPNFLCFVLCESLGMRVVDVDRLPFLLVLAYNKTANLTNLWIALTPAGAPCMLRAPQLRRIMYILSVHHLCPNKVWLINRLKMCTGNSSHLMRIVGASLT